MWWLPRVFAVPDLTPIALTQSNFWALFESPRASYLITNRGREEELSMRTWLRKTHILGQSSLSKPVLLGSPEIIRKKGWWRERQGRAEKTKDKKNILSLRVPFKVQKMDINCCFQNRSCFSSLPASHQKRSDYLLTYRVWQNDNVTLSWRSVNGSFWRGNYHIQSGSLSVFPNLPQLLWYRMTSPFTAQVMSVACGCGRRSVSLQHEKHIAVCKISQVTFLTASL